jgi:hypothetical protein
MLEGCQKYAIAINAKGRPFPTEPLIMAHFIGTAQNDKLARK